MHGSEPSPALRARQSPRVLIADDHGIVAEGIARLLAESYDVVDIVEDGERLVHAALNLEIDAIVADVEMPGHSGIKALKQIRASGSKVPFVFLSMHSEVAVVSAAMSAGANGYVLKANTGTELIVALETVLRGTPYVTPSLSARHLAAPSLTPRLTERQRAILSLIASGMGTKQIANDLRLSTRTVEAHRYTMMQMFHVHSAVELVQCATALGLLVVRDSASSDA